MYVTEAVEYESTLHGDPRGKLGNRMVVNCSSASSVLQNVNQNAESNYWLVDSGEIQKWK